MRSEKVQKLTTLALLIAIEILLSRFLSISTPIVKIGFSFLPIAIIAMLYGPLAAGMGYAAADFIGAWLFPIGPYFPGFTVTCFFCGMAYGLILYRPGKPVGWMRIFCAAAVVLLLQLVLDTVWVAVITGKGYLALLPARITKVLVMLPIQTASIGLVPRRFFPLIHLEE